MADRGDKLRGGAARYAGSVLAAVVAVCFLHVECIAQSIFVRPGDTISLPTPIVNATPDGAPGGDTINSMQLVILGDPAIVINAQASAAQSIAPGESKTFTPSFTVGNVDPSISSFTVTLHMVSSDAGILPDPDDPASDTLVSFTIDRTPPAATVWVTPPGCPGQTMTASSRTIQGIIPETLAATAAQIRVVINPSGPLAGVPNAISQVQVREASPSGTRIILSTGNVASVDWTFNTMDLSTYTITGVDAAGNVTSGSLFVHSQLPYLSLSSIKPAPLGNPPGTDYSHLITLHSSDTLGIAYVRFLRSQDVPNSLTRSSQLDSTTDYLRVFNDHPDPTEYYIMNVPNGDYRIFAKDVSGQLACGDINVSLHDTTQTQGCNVTRMDGVHVSTTGMELDHVNYAGTLIPTFVSTGTIYCQMSQPENTFSNTILSSYLNSTLDPPNAVNGANTTFVQPLVTSQAPEAVYIDSSNMTGLAGWHGLQPFEAMIDTRPANELFGEPVYFAVVMHPNNADDVYASTSVYSPGFVSPVIKDLSFDVMSHIVQVFATGTETVVPVGTNVAEQCPGSNVSAGFASVTQQGTFTCDEMAYNPPPPLLDARPGSLFKITTAATFSGGTILIPISTATVAPADWQYVQMYRSTANVTENVRMSISPTGVVTGAMFNGSDYAVVISSAADKIPPTTTLLVSTMTPMDGSGYPILNPVAGSAWGLRFSASDAAPPGVTPTGVSLTQYRDGPAPGGFLVIGAGAPLGEGVHRIDYRSWDAAGNLEVTKTAYVHIDATPPATTLQADGNPVSAAAVVASTNTIGLTAADALSGVAQTYYALDGGAQTAYGSSTA